MHTSFKVNKALPKYCVIIKSGQALGSDDPLILTEKERIAIKFGFLPEHVPIWNTHFEGKRKSASGKQIKKVFEYVQTYECKCAG